MVEHRLPKPRVASSNLVVRSILYAGVAQVVEQLIRNQQIGGSSPPASSSFCGDLAQQVRALRSHRRGRRFESYSPHHTGV